MTSIVYIITGQAMTKFYLKKWKFCQDKFCSAVKVKTTMPLAARNFEMTGIGLSLR